MATLVKTLEAHSNDVNSCAFSPTLLATGSGDKAIRLWKLPNFEELSFSPLLGHSYYVNCCVFSLFGTMLASCSTDGKIILWDTNSGESLQVWYHPDKSIVKVCAFSPDSQQLVTGATDNAICVFSTTTKQLIRIIPMAHENFVSTVCFTPNNTHIVSGSGNGDLKVWHAQNIHANKSLYYNPECQDLSMALSSLAVSPTFGSAAPNYLQSLDDRTYFLLATCGGDSKIKLWDLNISPKCNTRLRCALCGHTANVMMVAFSSDGKLLASGGMDKLVIVWCPIVGKMLFTLESHSRYITSVAFSMDNMFLASGSADRTAKIWRLNMAAPPAATQEAPPLIDLSSTGPQPGAPPSAPVASSVGPKPLLTWGPDDVADWLQEIGLGQYGDTFRENMIDGEEIQNLTNESLSQDLGVKALGHRQKILRAVKIIREQGFYSPGKPSDESVPDEYLCPITRQIMTDPVIAADGFSYERESIQSWLRTGNRTSPMTNAPLPHENLTPNRSLKQIIQRLYELT